PAPSARPSMCRRETVCIIVASFAIRIGAAREPCKTAGAYHRRLTSNRVRTNRRTAMFAYVGCYTSKERNGNGEGIGVYRIDPASGAWTSIQVVNDLVNPSWLTLDRQQRFLYAAHGDGVEATAFAIDRESGRLTVLNRQPTNGRNGVRLAVDVSN